ESPAEDRPNPSRSFRASPPPYLRPRALLGPPAHLCPSALAHPSRSFQMAIAARRRVVHACNALDHLPESSYRDGAVPLPTALPDSPWFRPRTNGPEIHASRTSRRSLQPPPFPARTLRALHPARDCSD